MARADGVGRTHRRSLGELAGTRYAPRGRMSGRSPGHPSYDQVPPGGGRRWPWRARSVVAPGDARVAGRSSEPWGLRLLLGVLILVAPTSGVEGQARDRPLLPTDLERVVHRAWTVDDGLPSRGVRVLEAPESGYLWVGTEEGLLRFDGHSFTVLDSTSVPRVSVPDVTDIFVDGPGQLLLTTRGSGVARVDGSGTTSIDTSDGLPTDLTSKVLRSPDGSIWIGTRGRGVVVLRGDSIDLSGHGSRCPAG